jgi:serine protease Do
MRLPSALLLFSVLTLTPLFLVPSTGSAEPALGNPRVTPIVELVRRVRDAVVNIHSERSAKGVAPEEFLALLPSQNRVNGMGTGILIDPRGYIITNHHVVDEVNLIRVRLNDGTNVGAKIVARDAEADLALLKIDVNRSLPVIPLGTANDLMVGETVVAIGNAYGYEHTVTMGIVSAIKRDVVLNKEVSYKSLIQTDASINPGNSGGPLLNINGELVGVNVAIRAGAQGIGFAIPVDSMLRVAADMLSIKKRNGLSHGLVYRDAVETDLPLTSASATDGPGANGWRRTLVVDRVESNSPAARAKLQREDVVVKVGDTAVSSGLDFERALLDHAAGDHVPVIVRRQGSEEKLDLVLQAGDKNANAQPDLVWQKLGVRVQAVGTEVVSQASKPLHGGLKVLEVRTNSAAARSGIQRNDILVGLHRWEMATPDNVVFVLTHPDLASFSPLEFYIIRAGEVQRGWLQQLD